MEKDKLIPIPPNISQMFLRTMGLYCSTYLGNDDYYLARAIRIITTYLGDKYMTEKYKELGKDWEKTEANFRSYEKKLMILKRYYDRIQDKTFSKKDKEQKEKSEFLKISSKYSLIRIELYYLYNFIMEKTTLQRQTIRSEAFKILEHAGFKKIEAEKKSTSPTSESTGTSSSS